MIRILIFSIAKILLLLILFFNTNGIDHVIIDNLQSENSSYSIYESSKNNEITTPDQIHYLLPASLVIARSSEQWLNKYRLFKSYKITKDLSYNNYLFSFDYKKVINHQPFFRNIDYFIYLLRKIII